MKKIIICILISLFSVNSFAGISSKIAKVVDQKISEGENFIQNLEEQSESGSDWLLSRIRMLSYVLVKFEIPFLEIKIMPMVEGRWVKKQPGRTIYQPENR